MLIATASAPFVVLLGAIVVVRVTQRAEYIPSRRLVIMHPALLDTAAFGGTVSVSISMNGDDRTPAELRAVVESRIEGGAGGAVGAPHVVSAGGSIAVTLTILTHDFEQTLSPSVSTCSRTTQVFV